MVSRPNDFTEISDEMIDSDAFIYEEEEEDVFDDGFMEDEEEMEEEDVDSEYEKRINDPEYSKKFIQALPVEVQQRVKALQVLQQKKNEIHQEYLNELLKLQQKYENDFEPLLNYRRSIIEGKAEPSDEAIKSGYPEEHFQYVSLTEGERTNTKGIPDFWLKVLKQSAIIRTNISPRDEEALSHLVDIRYKASPRNPSAGFTLFFEFSENPFFSETVLTKEYVKQPCVPNGIGEWYLSDIFGSKITWKNDEMNLTMEATRKKQRSKKTKEIRYVTVYESCQSFFSFFKAPKFPDSMKPPGEEKPEVTAEHSGSEEEFEDEELEDLIDEDYEIGSIIKEKIILRAVDYFTGETDNGSDYDEEFEEDFSEDDLDDVNSEDLTNRMISRCRVGKDRNKASEQPQEGANQEECRQQ